MQLARSGLSPPLPRQKYNVITAVSHTHKLMHAFCFSWCYWRNVWHPFLCVSHTCTNIFLFIQLPKWQIAAADPFNSERSAGVCLCSWEWCNTLLSLSHTHTHTTVASTLWCIAEGLMLPFFFSPEIFTGETRLVSAYCELTFQSAGSV